MIVLLALVACKPPIDACSGSVKHLYEPDSDELTAWPDDAFTVADSGSPTGLRVEASSQAWAQGLPGLLGTLPVQLDGASGFGTVGEIVLRFTDAIEAPPTGSQPSIDEDRLQLWDLDAQPPTRVGYRAHLLDGDRQLMLQPLRPLRTGHSHAVVMTDSYRASGQCVAPARRVTQALDAGEHEDLLEALSLQPQAISALLRFTTHDDLSVVVRAADAARAASQEWVLPLDCTVSNGISQCETAFEPLDFRGPSSLVVPTSTERHRVPVTWWLPEGVERPRVVFIGHGLGGTRADVQGMVDRLLPLGLAVVAVDALQHGDHPTATAPGAASALPFLGIDLVSGTFDGRRMRAHFDQSILERVQLYELIASTPDLDGDGTPDVASEGFGYVGLSLGGLMGSGTLALTDAEMGVLAIAGGDLASLTRETQVMANVLPLLATLAGSDAGLQRFLSVVQSIVDASDPAVWATHVLEDRVHGTRIPDVLLPVGQHDEIVPPPSGRALARAFALPHVAPVAEPVDGLVEVRAPVSNNHASGATVGFFQYDTVTVDGVSEPAVHGNVPYCDEGTLQIVHFVETWLDGQTTILNPF